MKNEILTFRNIDTDEVINSAEIHTAEIGLYECITLGCYAAYLVVEGDGAVLVNGFEHTFSEETLEQFDYVFGFEYIEVERHPLDYLKVRERFVGFFETKN